MAASQGLLVRAACRAALCAGLLLGVGAASSAGEPVLAEDQVTEAVLLDALVPSTKRSYKAMLRQPPRANLLVTFNTNSADLSTGAQRMLDVLAGALKNDKLAKARFTIEGHADPRGSAGQNLKLSQSRADSVRAYLTSSHGLAPERIQAVGKGSSAPLNPREPAAPENRRVTIVARPG